MKLSDKIKSFKAILSVRWLKKRVPLAVRFQLTNRCSLQCLYCNLWRIKTKELSTREIIYIIEELSKLGMKRISFSGGEPLLRNDIEEIIDYCNRQGIYSEMNSNGTLVAEKIKIVKKLDLLKLSFDGPVHIHDMIRQKGSYDKLIEATRVSSENNINLGFACTLTKYNIYYLEHILEIAEKYNAIIAFQPLKEIYRGVKDISQIAPSQSDFKRAIDILIGKKKKGNRNIRNSLIGLKHIYDWPRYKSVKCWAGEIFCIVNTNGDLYPCDRINYNLEPPNCMSLGVKKAIAMLPEVYCSGCGFCGALELNYLMRFRVDIISSIKKIIN